MTFYYIYDFQTYTAHPLVLAVFINKNNVAAVRKLLTRRFTATSSTTFFFGEASYRLLGDS